MPIKKNQQFIYNFVAFYLVAVTMSGLFLTGYLRGHKDTMLQVNSKISTGEIQDINAPRVKRKEYVPAYLKRNVDFDIYWETWKILQKNYVDKPISEPKLFYGSLKGMVDALDDPYTVFFDPEDTQSFQDDLSGSFEGIGAEVSTEDGVVIIVAPIEGSPAEQAGLLPGDYIISIDGKDTLGVSLDHAVRMIKGPKGSKVVLSVIRDNVDEVFDVAVTRDEIIVDSTESEIINDNIMYIDINHFGEDTHELVNKALDTMDENNLNKLIIDLRSNPGGFLETAIEVLGSWLGNQTVVQEEFGDGHIQVYKGRGKKRLEGIETIVLVNGGSASASEIMAGALQDYGVATLVGTQTFGKGSVQILKELSDGSSLKVTISKWLTPNNKNINKEGIKPDIEVNLTQEDRKAELDPQLDKAIELLND